MDIKIEFAKSATDTKVASPRSQFSKLLDEIELLGPELKETAAREQWDGLIEKLLSQMPPREHIVNNEQKFLRSQAEQFLSYLRGKTTRDETHIIRGRRPRCESLEDKAKQFQVTIKLYKKEIAVSSRSESPKPIRSPSYTDTLLGIFEKEPLPTPQSREALSQGPGSTKA